MVGIASAATSVLIGYLAANTAPCISGPAA